MKSGFRDSQTHLLVTIRIFSQHFSLQSFNRQGSKRFHSCHTFFDDSPNVSVILFVHQQYIDSPIFPNFYHQQYIKLSIFIPRFFPFPISSPLWTYFLLFTFTTRWARQPWCSIILGTCLEKRGLCKRRSVSKTEVT